MAQQAYQPLGRSRSQGENPDFENASIASLDEVGAIPLVMISKRLSTEADPLVSSSETRSISLLPLPQSLRSRSWRTSILINGILATCILIFNITVLIVATTSSRSLQKGRRIIYAGSCENTRRLDVVIHLIINLSATVLLGSSNYTMQCLTAPTREEIDKAHARKSWLDIGVSSVRNLPHISGRRVALWSLLLVSSLPLHLFYNSAVYSTVAAQPYAIFSVFPEGPLLDVPTDSWGNQTIGEQYLDIVKGETRNLSVPECIRNFAVEFQTNTSAVILVGENITLLSDGPRNVLSPPPAAPRDFSSDPSSWVCSNRGSNYCPLDYRNVLKDDDWAPLGEPVLYCLVKPAQEQCILQFAIPVAWVVIAFNALKVAILFGIYFGFCGHPLLTIGDAISSFLSEPDRKTQDLCLLSKRRVSQWSEPAIPRPYNKAINRRYARSVSVGRWFACLLLYAVALIVCLALFIRGYDHIGSFMTLAEFLSLGFGTAKSSTFIMWDLPIDGLAGFLSNVFVANVPQIILSMIYFTYNSIFTCFMLAIEWDNYSKSRKALRVSSGRRGAQRSTYFLQVPYRFAFPLIVLSGVIHWLASQSIFVVSIMQALNPLDGPINTKPGLPAVDPDSEAITCGYSPSAMFSLMCLGVVMVVAIIWTGTQKLSGTIPLASSCSAAISAACHIGGFTDQARISSDLTPEAKLESDAQDDDSEAVTVQSGEEAALLPLMWGDVTEADDSECAIRHCSFSSREVHPPQEGALYL